MADSGEKTEAFRGEFVEFSCFPPLTIGLGNTIIDGRPGRGNFSPVIAYNSKDPLFHFTARRSWYAAGIEQKEFRRLLDMVYIGNWILNSTRGEDRFQDYDKVESLLFEKARQEGMGILAETYQGETIPSRPFVEGGHP